MRLLITTQVVDANDPVLGFFVRWIEEFSKQVEHVEVICLKEGQYVLPANVRVHSLGKEKGVSRIKYVFNFYRYIWNLRHDYDVVFVHMNPEYIVLGGLLWRLWRKRIALWYTHKSVDMKLHLATFLTNIIFTASKESFRIKTEKVNVMGHGIDVDFFSPDLNVVRTMALLSVGRLSKVKRHDLVIRAAAIVGRELCVAGEGPERKNLESLSKSLGVKAHFLGGLTQAGLRDEYREAAFLVHTSETGSLDKVVLEALSCGLPVVTTSRNLSDLPVVVVATDPGAIAVGAQANRSASTEFLTSFVREHHSLNSLIPSILKII